MSAEAELPVLAGVALDARRRAFVALEAARIAAAALMDAGGETAWRSLGKCLHDSADGAIGSLCEAGL